LAVVETLQAIADLLGFFGRAEVRFQAIRFWPGHEEQGFDVARWRSDFGAVVLLPVYDGARIVVPARNLRKNETAEDAAHEIIARVLGVPKAA
jgi:hypothetical protein